MNARYICAIAIAFIAVACGKQQPPAEEPQAAAPTVEAESSTEPAKSMVNERVIRHMHLHADHMDEMMLALADDDLDGARKDAAWLYRHQEVEGIPGEWEQYLVGMREAARDVEGATDLETARAAAERVVASCQGCHAAAGINARQE